MTDPTPSAGTGSPSTPARGGDDWPAQAADTIVRVVGQVRDRTTGNAITAARGVVYGIIVGILATVALVLLWVLVYRGLVIGIGTLLSAFDADRAGRANWITNIVLGIGFTGFGAFAWRKATTRPAA